MDQEHRELIVRFQTDLAEYFKVPTNEISVPGSMGSYELTELINQLLKELHPEDENSYDFDFIVAGEILRNSLNELLEEKNVKKEITIDIQYIEKLKEPQLEREHEVEDWVIRLFELNNSILVGQANCTLQAINGQPVNVDVSSMTARTYELATVDNTNYLITGCLNSSIKLHSVKITKNKIKLTEESQFRNQTTKVESIGVNQSKQNLFAIGDRVGSVHIHDIKHQETFSDAIKSFNLNKQTITSILYNEDQLIAGSYDHSISIFDVNKERNNQLYCKDSAVLTISQQDQILISGHEDGIVRIWDLREHKQTKRQRAAQSMISCIKQFKQTQFLVGSFDGSVSIFDQRSEIPLFKINHPDTKILDVLYHSEKVYCGGSDKKVTVYQV